MLTPETIVVTNDVLIDVYNEVTRAIKLHKPLASLHEAHSVIAEEFDEFWDFVKMNPKKMNDDARAEWRKHIREELIQTAAMCVRAVYDLNL